MNEWVRVEMLEPEEDTVVIGAVDDDVFECLHLSEGVFNSRMQPTHWMPLPEPPEET